MLKVFALLSYLVVTLGYSLYCLFAFVAPALLAGEGLLCFGKLVFCVPQIAGMVNKRAIGEGGKVSHAQVNAYIFVTGGEGVRLANFAGTYRVPVLSLALDGQGFDRALYVAVQVQFDGANLRQSQVDPDDPFFLCRALFCLQLPACPIGITERIVAVAPLKSGIPWVLTVVDTPEEVVIGPFEAQDHILQHMRSNLLVLWSKLFDVYQFALLLVVADRVLSAELLASFLMVVVGMWPDRHLVGITTLCNPAL